MATKQPSGPKTIKGKSARKSANPTPPHRSKPAISRRTLTKSKTGQLLTKLRGIEGARGQRGKSVSRKDFLDVATQLKIAPSTAKRYAGRTLIFNINGTVSVAKDDGIVRVMQIYFAPFRQALGRGPWL